MVKNEITSLEKKVLRSTKKCLPFHRHRMCNLFQEGIQFLEIQQIVGLGVHLVIHLQRLRRQRKEATIPKERQEKNNWESWVFFVSLSCHPEHSDLSPGLWCVSENPAKHDE